MAAEVLAQPLAAGRAEDRHDVRSLAQQPGERDLGGGGAQAVGETLELGDHRHVVVEVLALQPRLVAAEVPAGRSSARVSVPVRKPRPSGEYGTKPIPSARQVGRISFSMPALPERVLGLQGADRMHGVRPADVGGAGLGEAQVADFAGPDQLGHGADDVLDRHGRVDPVLVQQVDAVGVQPPEGRVDDLADVLRPAVDARSRPSAPIRKPNLVASSTRSRRAPASSRPTSFSFSKGPVDLGRVEQGDPRVDRLEQRGLGLGALAAAANRPS